VPPPGQPLPAAGVHVLEPAAGRFGIESADGRNAIFLTGRLHFDVGDYLDYTPASRCGQGGRSCRRRRRGSTWRRLCRFQIVELLLQILDLRLVLLLEVSDLGLVLLLDCCDFGLVFLLDCSDRVLQLSDLITYIRRTLGCSGHRQKRACNGDHSGDRSQ